MNKKAKILLDEQKFPCFDMTKEERNMYLNIIRNCKDICDSENKVGDFSKCKIIQMVLRKKGSAVTFNGILSLGEDNKFENRCVNGELYVDNDSILVYMNVERLGSFEPKLYSVSDSFKIVNNILERKTNYSYIDNNIIEEIKDEKMKGLIK